MDEAYKNTFDLNYQYGLFLERMGLSEAKMHPVQKVQIKQAFYGATGQMLMLLRDDLAVLPEAEGVEKLDSLINQVGAYWLNQLK